MPSRYSIIPAEAIGDPRLSDGDIRVLAAIGTFTDQENTCWPSSHTVAAKANCSTRTVRRSVTQLAKCGYLQRVSRWGRSNVYVVKLDTPATTGQTATPVPHPGHTSPGRVATTVLHNVPIERPKESNDRDARISS